MTELEFEQMILMRMLQYFVALLFWSSFVSARWVRVLVESLSLSQRSSIFVNGNVAGVNRDSSRHVRLRLRRRRRWQFRRPRRCCQSRRRSSALSRRLYVEYL